MKLTLSAGKAAVIQKQCSYFTDVFIYWTKINLSLFDTQTQSVFIYNLMCVFRDQLICLSVL